MGSIRPSGLYCMYLRKSRKDMELEALGQGETLARHEKALRDLADRLGICVSQVYREVVSGDTIAERPQVRKLLEDVNNGLWDGVLVMDVDRLGRGDSIDQGVIMQSFLYANVLIVTPDKTYDPSDDSDAEFFEIKLFFSRREYSAIKKRMQRGRLASASEGCYMGSRPVYGYERYKLPKRKGWSLRIVPEKAAVVRAIFEWYAYGMDGEPVGAAAISARLTQMGLRTELGAKFEPSYIRYVLQNPVYIGKVRWNQRVTTYRIQDGKRVKSRERCADALLVDGLHEPIIDLDLWDTVQGMFRRREKTSHNVAGKIVNPLSGLIVCSQCGRAMQLKGDGQRGYGIINCTTQGCPTCGTRFDAVETAVLDALRTWMEEYRASLASPPSSAQSDQEAVAMTRKQLEDQRATLTRQMDSLFDLLEQGVYTPALYRQRRDDLTARLTAVDIQISDLPTAPSEDARAELASRIRHVLDAYASAPDAASKNLLLKDVVDHLVYSKNQRCYRNNAPGDYLSLDFYPLMPKDGAF